MSPFIYGPLGIKPNGLGKRSGGGGRVGGRWGGGASDVMETLGPVCWGGAFNAQFEGWVRGIAVEATRPVCWGRSLIT